MRKFRDLPTFGKNCIIYLRSRKYRCLTETCEWKIFTERFSDHFEPCRQRTKRLDESLLTTVLEMGGKSAERVCNSLSMPISDSTLLRLINKAPLPPLDQLKTGKIVDLLPDREEKSLETWLKKQPEIEVITRDRYHKYVRGATKGAPNALQVTDRWHLLKNLGEAVKRVMIREYSRLSKAIAPKTNSRQSNFPEALP